MENKFTEREILDTLKNEYEKYSKVRDDNGKSCFERVIDNCKGHLGDLLDLMGLPSEAEVKGLYFSPIIKTRPMLLVSDYHKPAKECAVLPTNEQELPENNPFQLIEKLKESEEIILGEYYPGEHKIVLYYNAIILDIAPIIYNLLQDETRVELLKSTSTRVDYYCRKCLSAAFTIVYAHEFFHAVHHQKGDFDNANLFLQESLARYFELLICGVCSRDSFDKETSTRYRLMGVSDPYFRQIYSDFGNAYAESSRNSLEQCPQKNAYKGALTFDKLFGTQLPAAVNCSEWLNNLRRKDLKDIIAPRYELLREMFNDSSDPEYKTFVDLHTSYKK